MISPWFKTKPTDKHPRGRWRWGRFYLVAVVLSFTVQLAYPGGPAWPDVDEAGLPAEQTATVARMTASGPVTDVAGDTVAIRYRAYGDADAGQTVILLHGSPTAGRDFAHLAPLLADHARVIVPDLPGFGRSSAWVPDYGCKAYARYTLALMDALGIEEAHMLGYSQGSGAALHMADLRPQRVRSLILYGGIGIQEGEGSGDYLFEHTKYAAGYALIVVGAEFVPHFGLLGKRSWRHAFIRNFQDTDQRPLRGVLQRLNESKIPLLILQGADDVLVPADTAREHHQIVTHSELVMYDAGHLMVYNEEGSRKLAEEIVPFMARAVDPATAPARRTVDDFAGADAEAADSALPIDLGIGRRMSPWLAIFAMVVGGLISEDLTCVTVGLLVARGQIDIFVGLFGCWLALFVGDAGFWLIGRLFLRRLMRVRWIEHRLPQRRLERLAEWFDRRGWLAILAARFMPGLRVLTYLAAGMLGRRGIYFNFWMAVSIAIWVPLIVIGSALLGDTFIEPLMGYLGGGWVALIVAIVLLFVLVRCAEMVATSKGRRILNAKVSWWWKPEFWPRWLFYAPLGVWLVILSIRHRSATVWMLADPCMPAGRMIHESKVWVLDRLPSPWVLPGFLAERGKVAERVRRLVARMETAGWSFPIVLKPNQGCRGTGVARIESLDDARSYFEQNQAPAVAQVLHEGPLEAGVFYVRMPDEQRGRILSITDKHFPHVTGDGESTLVELILADRRLRMQYRTFATAHAEHWEEVIPLGQELRIGFAGNHAQGTMFRDGQHLITPLLEDVIDKIARQIDGFYFGRFDLRYPDETALKEGRDFAIVELNMATSESTNVYDPDWSVWRRYRVLFEQWSLAYRIGAQVCRGGMRPPGLWALLRQLRG